MVDIRYSEIISGRRVPFHDMYIDIDPDHIKRK